MKTRQARRPVRPWGRSFRVLHNASCVWAHRACNRNELVERRGRTEDPSLARSIDWTGGAAHLGQLAALDQVSELRVARYSSDVNVANAAKANFGELHVASLLLSMITVCLAGGALACAASLPRDQTPTSTSARFLLRHAMRCAEAPDQIGAVDADDFAIRQQFGEDASATRSAGSLKVGTMTMPFAR